MSFKNDVAFLLDCFINLYEHQSTYNPNMAIRGYLYFAQLFEKFITSRNLNIYSSTLQKLPTPKYLVFYNGTKEEPEETFFRLSDAFLQKGGCLECEATMLNINYGKNKKLMEKCKKLEEYALFISKVRALLVKGKPLETAINQAIDESIEENILKDILTEQRAEVLGVLLSTFNKELYEKELKQDAYSEGLNDGLSQGIAQGRAAGAQDKLSEQIQKKLARGKSVEEIAEELEESVEVIKELVNVK